MEAQTKISPADYKNAYGAPISYMPRSPIPEVREYMLDLMRRQKEIVFQVDPSRKKFGGFDKAARRPQGSVGFFRVKARTNFTYGGKEYSCIYNEIGIDIFDVAALTDRQGKALPNIVSDPAHLLFTDRVKVFDVRNAEHMKAVEFLMHSDMNGSFPFRRENAAVFFNLYDPTKSELDQRNRNRRIVEISNMIYQSELGFDVLVSRLIAAIRSSTAIKGVSTEFHGTSDPDVVKDRLIDAARMDPDAVRRAMMGQDQQYTNLVRDAQQYGVLRWNPDSGDWENLMNSGPKVVANVPSGASSADVLVRALKADADFTQKVIAAVKAAARASNQ